VTGNRDARRRVLDATIELLREGGLRAASPAAVAERAGAGKMSLYRHFDTKDALVAEALDDYIPAQLATLFGAPDSPDLGPRDRILSAFDRLARCADTDDLSACVYVVTRVEVADPGHPVAAIARDYKQQVAQYLSAALRELGHPAPDSTASTISMLLDAAVMHAIITGSSQPIRDARSAVEHLTRSENQHAGH
jgi:AcrR family transcriptional regulator